MSPALETWAPAYGKKLVWVAKTTTLTGTLRAGIGLPVDTTSGAASYTIPAAATVPAGDQVAVKKASTDTNTITLSRSGSDVIYGTGTGATTKIVFLSGEVVTLQSDGTSSWTVVATDTPSSSLINTYPLADLLASGEETVPRKWVSSSIGTTTGRMYLTYFTARKTETITKVRTLTAATAAAATPSLCRAGIYSIDSAGAGTLVASIANNTSLWASTNTAYTSDLSASWPKVAGQRYAFALLTVSGATCPGFPGSANDFGTGFRAELAMAPRVTGYLGSQTDLPASFADASLTTMNAPLYAAVIP